jgi:hypothetical protein
MWRRAKAIIIAWLIGVVCGIAIILAAQNKSEVQQSKNPDNQTVPQTTDAGPSSTNPR